MARSSDDYLWEYVTDDKYELPIYVADDYKDLAKMVGVRPNNILSAIAHSKVRGNRCVYQKVYVGDEDDGSDRTDT